MEKGISMTRHRDIANIILRMIHDGLYEERDALPPERTLAKELSVSRETIRKTIKILENQGYLVAVQGRGTFVTPHVLRKMKRSIDSFSDEARHNGHQAGQDILFFGNVTAPVQVARSLNLENGSKVLRIHRIRKLDNVPIGIHDSYIAIDRDQITKTKLQTIGSLYSLLNKEFDLTLTDAAEKISAVVATLEEAKWLGIDAGHPLLHIERITISKNMQPIEFCVMKYGPNYNYNTVVHQRHVGGS